MNGPSSRSPTTVVKSLVDYARSVDSTHFITYVTGGAKFGRVSGLLDIISTNWAQYQWYDPFTCLDSEEGKKSLADLDKIHEAFPDKPVILDRVRGRGVAGRLAQLGQRQMERGVPGTERG